MTDPRVSRKNYPTVRRGEPHPGLVGRVSGQVVVVNLDLLAHAAQRVSHVISAE